MEYLVYPPWGHFSKGHMFRGVGEWPPWRGEVYGDDDELEVSVDRQNAGGADASAVVPPTAGCEAYREDHDRPRSR